jgi:S-DNA-T family DNA segregation ATPase FtsK/SpoIIIE
VLAGKELKRGVSWLFHKISLLVKNFLSWRKREKVLQKESEKEKELPPFLFPGEETTDPETPFVTPSPLPSIREEGLSYQKPFSEKDRSLPPVTPEKSTEEKKEKETPFFPPSPSQLEDEPPFYKLPPTELLTPGKRKGGGVEESYLKEQGIKLQKKIQEYGVEGVVMGFLSGPVVTLYEFKPAPGIKISKVISLEDDLALHMGVPSIRIAPLPGKQTLGIEIPNPKREMVLLRPLLESPEFQHSSFKLPVVLGKNIEGKPVIYDLAQMPHLLVAGTTGAGKSIGIHGILVALLFRHTAKTLRVYLIDPKRLEFNVYYGIPHLEGHDVFTDPYEAHALLETLVEEMEERYENMAKERCKNIESFNQKVGEKDRMPYLVCIIDELSDLMFVTRKKVEDPITRLAQMARASGIHLVVATQRPSVDVITGLIKANFPARIAYKVVSKTDSRVILDMTGAETLLGKGDMLFKPPTTDLPLRVHGAYLSEEEVQKVVDHLKKSPAPKPVLDRERILKKKDTLQGGGKEVGGDVEEELLSQAIALGEKEGWLSTSRLQRYLGIGYNKAAKIMDELEAKGYVGPPEGAGKPRRFKKR